MSEENNKTEQAINKAVKDLGVGLPITNAPITLKLIALATLAGGLSIIGSTLVDIVSPSPITGFFYILRLITGIMAITIAYGITEKKRWALWLYGFIVLISLVANPGLAILPGIILTYLFIHRAKFEPSLFDFMLADLTRIIKKRVNEFRSRHQSNQNPTE